MALGVCLVGSTLTCLASLNAYERYRQAVEAPADFHLYPRDGETLDRTLAARTRRDLATITQDLPGEGSVAQAGPVPPHTVDSWHAAMREQRDRMRELAQRHPGMSHHLRGPGHPGRRHGHGPGRFVPILVLLMVAMVVTGGAGLFKLLFFVALGAMVFSLVKRVWGRR